MDNKKKEKSEGEKLAEKLLSDKKNGGLRLSEEKLKKADKFCEGYKSFLNTAKTEREAVIEAVAQAEKAGFKPYEKGKKYDAGDKFYFVNRGKAIILTVMGKDGLEKGIRLAAAHIDSPRLDLKQNPLYEDKELCLFKTHYYGGIKKYQWTTVPMSLHGVVIKADGESVTVNIGEDKDDILITTGAQQIMDLCSKALVNEGDVVICEAPSFIGSLNTFRSYNAKLAGVPVEPDGMNTEKLEEALKANPNAKLIYTIPNFQNPSGVTMSLEKRKKVYELAKKYGVLIIEDNPYGDLRYSGEYVPNIKSFDTDGIVIYAGSFSKVISPGMRVAYTIAPKPIFQKLVVCKQGNDVHTNIWSQYVCDEFITKYDFNAHLAKLREIYTKKANFCMELLDKYCAPKITYHKIDGGLFIWCDLPEDIDMPNFCKGLVLKKVCVVPGNAFLTDENETCHSFRINFSTPTDEQLERGIKILGEYANSL